MRAILLLILLFTCAHISAQNHYLGLRGGVNFSKMQSSSAFNRYVNMKLGACAGVTYEYAINDVAGLGVDLLYNQRGFKYSQYHPYRISYAIGIDYLSVPLKVTLKSRKPFHFKLNFGVMPSKVIRIGGFSRPGMRRDLDYTGLGMDVSMLAEMGVGKETKGGTRWYFLAGYQYGAVQHKMFDGTSNKNLNHADITFSVGFMSPLRKAATAPTPAEK
jgi:hypothetical protein